MEQFVEEGLVNMTTSFFSVLHKHKLDTFESLSKPIVVGVGKEKAVVKSDTDLFQRLIVASQMCPGNNEW